MRNEKHIQYYATLKGKIPLHEWLVSFKDPTIRARIIRRIEKLALGYYGDVKVLKNSDGIQELRLDFGSGYRIYFSEHEDVFILLLYGGDKSTQKRDIQMAKKYLAELRSRE